MTTPSHTLDFSECSVKTHLHIKKYTADIPVNTLSRNTKIVFSHITTVYKSTLPFGYSQNAFKGGV